MASTSKSNQTTSTENKSAIATATDDSQVISFSDIGGNVSYENLNDDVALGAIAFADRATKEVIGFGADALETSTEQAKAFNEGLTDFIRANNAGNEELRDVVLAVAALVAGGLIYYATKK